MLRLPVAAALPALPAAAQTLPPPTAGAVALDGPDALKLTRLELGLEMRGLFEFYIRPPLDGAGVRPGDTGP